jgi:hypothetical protein
MRHGFDLGQRWRFRGCPHQVCLARVAQMLQPQLTLPPQSETVSPSTGLGGRQDAYQDSGNSGFGRFCFVACCFIARGGRTGANRSAGYADGAGIADSRGRALHATSGPASGQARSHLSAVSGGTRWRLSQVFPRPKCGAGVQRNLRAGVPAERHGDRPPHELLLAPRLKPAVLSAFAARRSARRRPPALRFRRREWPSPVE